MRNSHTTHQPIDGPVDGPYSDHHRDGPVYDKREQTGLLTRFVPDKFKGASWYRWLLRFTRVLQFVSSVISLGAFSQRLYKVYRLVNVIKTRRGVNKGYGAVEGILAAAVLYTLITMLLGCIKKSANPGGRILRWIWVLVDILFVGAFIAVSVITRPNGGNAGPRHCYNPSRLQSAAINAIPGANPGPRDDSCNLPWATFLLAIFSTLLHALTASFHEIKDYRHKKRLDHEKAVPMNDHHDRIAPVDHHHQNGVPVNNHHQAGVPVNHQHQTTAPVGHHHQTGTPMNHHHQNGAVTDPTVRQM